CGNGQAVRLQPVDMKTDGFADFLLNSCNAIARGDTARQVWHVSRIVAFRLFDHDCITHQRWSLKPACFKMLFNVPGARSSDGFSGDCHATGLFRMLVLAMATSGRY